MTRNPNRSRTTKRPRSRSDTGPGWPLAAVWRQVLRTLACQPGTALLLILLVTLTCGGLTLAEANMRQNAFDYQTRLTVSGQYMLKASARTETGEGLISAAACVNLNRVTGVKAAAGFAGGARGFTSTQLTKAPGEYLTTQTVVGNVAPIIDPSSPARYEDGFLIDATLAKRLGIAEGARLELAMGDRNAGESTWQRQTAVAHVLDASARKFNESQTLYAMGPATGTVAECLVEFEPGAYNDTARQTLAAALDDGHTVISITPFLTADSNATPPLDQYRARISRWFWLVSGLACCLMLAMPLVFRRHEFALYRSVGAGRNPTALIYALSNAFMLAVGHAAGFLWMLLLFAWTHRSLPPMAGALAMTSGASFLVALGAVTLCCMLLARGNMATFIQKRL